MGSDCNILADIPEADLEIHVEDCGGEVEGELGQAECSSSIPVPASNDNEREIPFWHIYFSHFKGFVETTVVCTE